MQENVLIFIFFYLLRKNGVKLPNKRAPTKDLSSRNNVTTHNSAYNAKVLEIETSANNNAHLFCFWFNIRFWLSYYMR